jgi:hypothetical protein
MKPLYIFDLDGTLALIEHRRKYVERQRGEQDWKAFYAACVDDHPNDPVIDTMERLREAGAEIWIFSGRSDEVRAQTVTWLADNTTFMSWELLGMLFMRQAGDYTPDYVLKKRWFDNMPAHDKARLVAVFEDRDRMVKMWRTAGVPCFQVAEGEF